MSVKNEWEELIDRHLRGELSESEMERLAERLDSDAAARREFVELAQWDTQFAEAMRETPLIQDVPHEAHRSGHKRALVFFLSGLAIAAAVIIAVSATMYFMELARGHTPIKLAEGKITKITGLSGPVMWTGEGGRIIRNVTLGMELSGGTIDGMSPDSWAELEFKDGSKIIIIGHSVLTFSALGQKELHLKSGHLSARVAPQPQGRPLLIHTRLARLEVLGTRFEVEAGLSSTSLSVSKGIVRVQRLSDGKTVDVPAQHRVVAAPDRELVLMQTPESVHRWKSQIQHGPNRMYGKWMSGTKTRPAQLRAIPYTTERGMTIYVTSLRVSSCDTPSVVLQPDSRIRVRGRIDSVHKVYFGLTVRKPNGDFGGRFQTILPAGKFNAGQDFEVVLELRDYVLDPSLNHMKGRLPSDPCHLVVEDIWCHTLFDPAGLAISEMELIPPETP